MNDALRLSGHTQEYVDDNKLAEENRQLRIQIRQLDEALRLERLKSEAAAAGVRELRRMLTQPFKAMQAIFGEIDQIGLDESAAAPQASNAKWESWKQRMPGNPAQFIDMLLIHENMSVAQLMAALHWGKQKVYVTASKLGQAGLVINNGGRYSLKSL